MTALALILERTGLGLEPLQIGPGHAGLFVLAGEDGAERPDTVWEREYATKSRFIDGNTQVSATLGNTALNHTVLIRAQSVEQRAAALELLELSAARQDRMIVTEIFDAEAPRRWDCSGADMNVVRRKSYRAAHLALVGLSWVCQPLPLPDED